MQMIKEFLRIENKHYKMAEKKRLEAKRQAEEYRMGLF